MTDFWVFVATTSVATAAAIIGFLLKLNRGMQEIHVMVNSRMQEALARIDQLHKALVDAGVVVPDHPPQDQKDQES